MPCVQCEQAILAGCKQSHAVPSGLPAKVILFTCGNGCREVETDQRDHSPSSPSLG